MALPAAFLEELRARTPLASVVGRRVKLARSGRNWKGCCPFHNERTPSFYVYEDGYHCFGCGAHGDAISFVMQTEGAEFREVVDRLSSEAGLEVPRPSPQAAAAERVRQDVHGALAAAAELFAAALRGPEGQAARAYLKGRGLDEAAMARFGLGWAGPGRGTLTAALRPNGIEPALLLEAGLLRVRDDGSAAESFFNRVMFPIRDLAGRIVSFGGRTLGDGQPKYVNGPETPVFAKRRTLFGADLARAALRTGAPLLVTEGYMDVIALHLAGFGGAVAPLGTALTEEHLAQLWRLSPMPVLCFDGDAAGARAAMRAAETALPLLTPEQGLRIATLPANEDPDSLVRRGGPAAFQAVLDAARPLSDVLYGLLAEGAAATPEARAALRARLVAAADRIGDRNLAQEYRRALLDRFFAAGRIGRGSRSAPIVRPVRPAPAEDSAQAERARVLLAIVLRHPAILHDVADPFSGLVLPQGLSQLRDAVLAHAEHADVLDSAGLLTHVRTLGLATEADRALASTPLPLPGCAAADAPLNEAQAGWWLNFGLLDAARLQAQVADARADFALRPDLARQSRLTGLRQAEIQAYRDIGEAPSDDLAGPT